MLANAVRLIVTLKEERFSISGRTDIVVRAGIFPFDKSVTTGVRRLFTSTHLIFYGKAAYAMGKTIPTDTLVEIEGQLVAAGKFSGGKCKGLGIRVTDLMVMVPADQRGTHG